MFKNFIEWIHTKMRLDGRVRKINSIKEGEVYWCALGENIGDEENGKGNLFRRPVLVFKKFNNNIFWGISMSTKNKGNIYYVKVLLKDIEQSAIISQLRILDSKRLDLYIGYISKDSFVKIQSSVKNLIQ